MKEYFLTGCSCSRLIFIWFEVDKVKVSNGFVMYADYLDSALINIVIATR